MTKQALTAIRPMRTAPTLLDAAQEPIAAARLQHAIDGVAE